MLKVLYENMPQCNVGRGGGGYRYYINLPGGNIGLRGPYLRRHWLVGIAIRGDAVGVPLRCDTGLWGSLLKVTPPCKGPY